jgi:hypothetical protein
MPVEKNEGLTALESLKTEVKAELAAGKGADDGKGDAKAVDERRTRAAPAAEVEEDPEERSDEGAEDETEAEAEGEGEKEEKPKPEVKPKKDWLHAARDKARQAARDERARADAAEGLAATQAAEIARMRALIERQAKGEAVKPEEVAAPKSEKQLEDEATARAEARIKQEASVKEFVVKADKLLEDGIKAFGQKEFETARDNVIGYANDLGLFDNNTARVEFLQQLLDAVDNPERVLFLMGQDPEEAERIVGLSERKRIAAFVKLSTARPRKAPTSEVPEPIEEVRGVSVAPTTYKGPGTSPAVMDKLFKDSMQRIAQRRRG